MAMTRKEVGLNYTVKNETVRDPGKFEGEPAYVVSFYDSIMNGASDGTIDDPDGGSPIDYFYVSAEDRKEFPDLEGVAVVTLWETDQGFVYHKDFASEKTFEKAKEHDEKLLEERGEDFEGHDEKEHWEVIVGNIGPVYHGHSKQEAEKVYKEYVKQSKSGQGKAGGEFVTILVDGETHDEHEGSGKHYDRYTEQGVEGYIESKKRHVLDGTPLKNWKGKKTKWKVHHTVKTYTNRMGDRSAAVVLVTDKGHDYAAGYLLIDGGSLFRGKLTDMEDAERDAESESEYWAEKDAEDEEKLHHEDEGLGDLGHCAGTVMCQTKGGR